VSNTMQVSIAAGTAAVALGQPNYSALCRWDAAEVVTLTAAPPSGQSRIDLIVLQVRDAATDAGSNNDFIFQAIAGSPTTGTPTPPNTPAASYIVAQVLVPGGAANLNGATITDRRAAMSIAQGLPPALGAGAAFQSYTDPNGVVWVAKGGVNSGAWRQARDVLHARMMRSALYTLSTASGGIPFDITDFDPFGIWSPGYAAFIIPVSGLWLVSGQIYAVSNGANQSLGIAIGKFGAGTPIARSGSVPSPVISGLNCSISQTVKLAAGDQIQIWASSSPVGLSTTYADTANIFGVCQYVGTG